MVAWEEGGIEGLSFHIYYAMPIDPFLEIRLRLQAMDNEIVGIGIQIRRFFHVWNMFLKNEKSFNVFYNC